MLKDVYFHKVMAHKKTNSLLPLLIIRENHMQNNSLQLQ